MPKLKTISAGRVALVPFLVGISLLVLANPAIAHHAFGNETPTNFFEGFLSGVAHPIIGLDHFAFVVAIGLFAAIYQQGIFIPVAFVAAAMAGTGLHLMSLDLPVPELVISASVLGMGVMLAMKDSPKWTVILGLAAIAGIFHGYAYGESIVGAEMTPLVAYLAGFTFIQLVIAWIALALGKVALQKMTDNPSLYLRFAGFTISGIGVSFLATSILG